MAKRLFDVLMSAVAIFFLSPIFLVAAWGIVLSDGFPILYKANRMGMDNNEFLMYKFRTMKKDKKGNNSLITGKNDSRIFKFGEFLRKTKIDELPQLFNVLKGDMSIVGPRPEDVNIVKNHYSDKQLKTLSVLPGLASPGSIFNYTHGESYVGQSNAERDYIDKFLSLKLELELYYIDNKNFFYDLEIIYRTIKTIVKIIMGKKEFEYPVEYKKIYRNSID